MGDILVIVEHHDNEVDTLSLQLLNKARHLAEPLGARVLALVLGSGIDTVVDRVSEMGADSAMVADYPELSPYNPEIYCRLLTEMIRASDPALVLLGHTFLGMEVAPAVSTRLGIRLASNCTDIELSDDGLPVVARPVYGGTKHVKIMGDLPLMISVQKGGLVGETRFSQKASLIPFRTEIDVGSLRTRITSVLKPSVGEVDISKANVIVGVGRGIGQPANIDMARKLASALGGVIAATRPVIDQGWLPPEYLVGLSGAMVSPRVYIACGISGAAQHLAGMGDAQMIIAINKDLNAPIFNVAHYAVVGDLFQIVPALIESAGVKA